MFQGRAHPFPFAANGQQEHRHFRNGQGIWLVKDVVVCNLPPVDDDAVSSNMTSWAESLNLMHGTETRGVSVEWRHSL